MSIVKELKTEIVRQARKEIRKEMEPVKRVNAAQRKLIANLRRDVTELQREVNRLQKAVGKAKPKPVESEAPKGFWMSGKGVRSLRRRLGVTQMELAKLADVSHQSVVRWEKSSGKIPFRKKETPARMQQLREMEKRTAWEILGKKKTSRRGRKPGVAAKASAKAPAKKAAKAPAKKAAKAAAKPPVAEKKPPVAEKKPVEEAKPAEVNSAEKVD